MARKITTGTVGRAVLGSIKTIDNTIQAVEANADLVLDANGSATAVSGSGITRSATDFQIDNSAQLRFADGDSSRYVGFKASATVTNNVTWTLPTADGAGALTSNGSGVLSFSPSSLTVADQLSDSSTYYPAITTATSGSITQVGTSSSKLSYVPSTGTLTATALVESSSITLKENISPIEDALEKIMQLAGVVYDRKDGSSKNEAGLIAEDTNKILPNIVTKDNLGNPQGINYTKISAYLIEAVKELSTKIDKLK